MNRFHLIIFLFAVAINLDAQSTPVNPKKTDGRLLNRLTTKAEFPGGYPAFIKFLQKNIQYPQMERDNDIMGKVMVRFMVDTSGDISNAEVVKHVSPGLDKEAVRVVKLLPKFTPAMYYKKQVPVYYVVDVNFRIQ